MVTPYKQAMAIVEEVAKNHRVSVDLIFSPIRRREVVKARVAAIKAIHRAYPSWSSVRIGRFFNRDHTTILHHLRDTGMDAEFDQVVVEYRFRNSDLQYFIDVYADRELHGTLGPFHSEAARQSALDDMLAMVRTLGGTEMPAREQ